MSGYENLRQQLITQLESARRECPDLEERIELEEEIIVETLGMAIEDDELDTPRSLRLEELLASYFDGKIDFDQLEEQLVGWQEHFRKQVEELRRQGVEPKETDVATRLANETLETAFLGWIDGLDGVLEACHNEEIEQLDEILEEIRECNAGLTFVVLIGETLEDWM